MHHRQGQREAARHTHRRADGRFAALSAPGNTETSNTATSNYRPCPVGVSTNSASCQNTPLNLPPVEDTAA
jgi:hypothetical protein